MKSSVYTRSGDQGTTSLVGGARINKDHDRLEAYGTIDELSASLGLIASITGCPEEVAGQVKEIQNTLFEVGGYLATRHDDGEKFKLHGISDEMKKIESWIDVIDEQLPKLNSFILPGGGDAAARFHLARTVCRRAERRVVTLASREYVDPELIAYINRLSDYLFVASRYCNFLSDIEEVAWKRTEKR